MIRNLFAVLAFLMMASGAHARFSVFSNADACEIAKSANLVTPYSPSTKSPFQGGPGWTKAVVPEGGACLGDAYVMEDGVAVKGKTVYVAGRFDYWFHTNAQGVIDAYRMHDCSNPFGEITFLGKKPEPVPQAAVPQAPVVVQAPPQVIVQKTTVVDDITMEHRLHEKVICASGVEVQVVGGKATCPTIQISAPAKVDMPTHVEAPITVAQSKPVYVQPQSQQQPIYVPPVKTGAAEACTSNCQPHPEVTFDRKVARTDGRCVVAFKDPAGTVHYARFDTKKGTNLLVGAKVDNVQGDWNHSYTPTYVGYISPNGEKKTVQLDQPASCEAVFKAISNPTVFAWTGPRLQLTPDCRPERRV